MPSSWYLWGQYKLLSSNPLQEICNRLYLVPWQQTLSSGTIIYNKKLILSYKGFLCFFIAYYLFLPFPWSAICWMYLGWISYWYLMEETMSFIFGWISSLTLNGRNNIIYFRSNFILTPNGRINNTLNPKALLY